MSQGGAPGQTRGRGGEAEGGDPPGRRGSHSLLPETPPHSAAHPPSRGWLPQGCFSRARQRVAVSSHSALVARPPRHPPAARAITALASPAPLGRAQWRRREKVADPLRNVAHSTTRPRPRRLLPAPRAGKGGWEAGRRVRSEGPGGKGSQGAEQKPKAEAAAGGAAREIQSPNVGDRHVRRQLGPPTRPPEPKGSEASARGGPWRKAGIQAKAGAVAVSSAS